MWPFRLANGLLLAGLALPPARWRAAWVGAWLAAILLLHTFTAQIAFLVGGIAGLHALITRRWARAGQLAGGAALALLATLPFWGPLLDPTVRIFHSHWEVGWLEPLVLATLPVEVIALVQGQLRMVGGWLALGWALPVWAGALLALGLAPRRGEAAPLAKVLLALALLVCGLSLLMLVLAHQAMGPNPWRHLAHGRTALALAAGGGLLLLVPGPLSRRLALGLSIAAAVLAAGLGLRELPFAVQPQGRALIERLDRVWEQLALHRPERVYQVDTFASTYGPAELSRVHPGGVGAARHSLELAGGWYSVTPVATSFSLMSESDFLFGAWRGEVEDLAAFTLRRMGLFGIDSIVTIDPQHHDALAGHPEFQRVAHEPPFAAFTLASPALPVIGARPPAKAEQVEAARGQASAMLVVDPGEAASAPIEFRLRQSWHPWWSATLDGEPVELREDPSSGLIIGEAPHSGHLALRFEDRGRPLRPWGALGMVLLGLSLTLARLTGKSPRRSM